jgi:hypothetical protein
MGAPEVDRLFSSTRRDWLNDHDNPTRWEKGGRDPHRASCQFTHTQLKRQLLPFIRERARRGWITEGAARCAC